MVKNKKIHFRKRLLLPIIFMVLFLAVCIPVISYYQHQEYYKDYSLTIKQSFKDAYDYHIDMESRILTMAIDSIQSSSDIKKAWQNKDRKLLRALNTDNLKYLKKKYGIDYLSYFEKGGWRYIDVHNKYKKAGKSNRKTVNQSIMSKKPAQAIEFDSNHNLFLSIVLPYTINNEIVGYIEIGKKLKTIIDQIREFEDYEAIISIDNEIEGKKSSKYYGNIISYAVKDDDLVKNITKKIKEGAISTGTEHQIIDENFLIMGILIKDDVSGVGFKLIIAKDISNIISEQRMLLYKQMSLSIAVLLFIFVVYYFYIGFLQKGINVTYKNLMSEIKDNKINEKKLMSKISEGKSKEKKLINDRQELMNLVDDRETRLSSDRKRYQVMFEESSDAFMVLYRNEFIDCNNAALEMFGYDNKQEIFKLGALDILPDRQPDGSLSKEKSEKVIKIVIEKGSHRFEWECIRKNGSRIPVEVLLTRVPFEKEFMIHSVYRDITDRKKAEAEVQFRAYYDQLTRLPNRQLMLDRIEQTRVSNIRNKTFGAVLFINIDRFKVINDTYGHAMGDELILGAAERIKSFIRKEDSIARFGGDEFVVLLKNLVNDRQSANMFAEKVSVGIQKTLQDPFKVGSREFYITVSVGVSVFPTGTESSEEVIRHSNIAMHKAKEKNGNEVCFYLSDMHKKIADRLELEKDLRQALKEVQLETYYQPQLDADENVVGIEALVRWNHPEKGFQNPEEFVRIAEETGLIYELGGFVFDKTLLDLTVLQNMFKKEFQLSINISPNQFMKEDFVQFVKERTNKYNINRKYITLEVTEGIAINNLQDTIDKFNELRGLGFRMSLDDFGTGYSSLSYLKELPLDELKIDKSFVFDVLEDDNDAQLVKTVIDIAEQFDLESVAEGVETKEQLDFLKQSRCKVFQGYYHSRPLSFKDLKDYLRKKDLSNND